MTTPTPPPHLTTRSVVRHIKDGWCGVVRAVLWGRNDAPEKLMVMQDDTLKTDWYKPDEFDVIATDATVRGWTDDHLEVSDGANN